MIRIDPAAILTPGVCHVLRALNTGGAVARLVGGCIRDVLLGEPVGDRDVAVDVPPEESVRLLERSGIRVKPVGIAYGSILALPPEGGVCEVTSLRRDIESHGRWPVVRFGGDWAQDARRRDFTMNALYADADGTVHDPLGGIVDIRTRRVRFIGSARDRVREDYLRILRFFRFHAWYGTGPLDSEGLQACTELAARIARLSGERVGQEMRKLLSAPAPATAIGEAERVGVLARVMPGARPASLDALVRLEREFGFAPDWRRRWLLLLAGAPGNPLDCWPLSRREERDLRVRLKAWRVDAPPIELGHRWGAQAAEDSMLVRAARGGTSVSVADLSDARAGADRELPISAADIIRAGTGPGPEVGRALGRARRHWLHRRMQAGREELIEAALGLRP